MYMCKLFNNDIQKIFTKYKIFPYVRVLFLGLHTPHGLVHIFYLCAFIFLAYGIGVFYVLRVCISCFILA